MKETFNVNLAGINELFNNKTFKYRINGFAHACKMDDIGVVQNGGVLFTSNDYNENNNQHSYYITTSENNNGYGKSITLSGHYDDLYFTFINQFNNEKLNSKIIDLPFFIALTKTIDDETYKFTIETVEKARTKFMMTKTREFKDHSLHDDICFYANIMDFSQVLKIIKGFVYNPKLGFNTYNEMMQKQKVVFTNNMIDKLAMKDDDLDKPCNKIMKKIRKIIN